MDTEEIRETPESRTTALGPKQSLEEGRTVIHFSKGPEKYHHVGHYEKQDDENSDDIINQETSHVYIEINTPCERRVRIVVAINAGVDTSLLKQRIFMNITKS